MLAIVLGLNVDQKPLISTKQPPSVFSILQKKLIRSFQWKLKLCCMFSRVESTQGDPGRFHRAGPTPGPLVTSHGVASYDWLFFLNHSPICIPAVQDGAGCVWQSMIPVEPSNVQSDVQSGRIFFSPPLFRRVSFRL